MNVKVRRFTRYTLGEGIEVEETDFAAGGRFHVQGLILTAVSERLQGHDPDVQLARLGERCRSLASPCIGTKLFTFGGCGACFQLR